MKYQIHNWHGNNDDNFTKSVPSVFYEDLRCEDGKMIQVPFVDVENLSDFMEKWGKAVMLKPPSVAGKPWLMAISPLGHFHQC